MRCSRTCRTALLLAVAILGPGHPVLAQAAGHGTHAGEERTESGPPKSDAGKESPKPEPAKPDPGRGPIAESVTTHTVQLNDRTVAYTATAGSLPLANAKGETAAHIFYVAYAADPAGTAGTGGPNRPLTFVFNGGPGAASAFLHLGAMGPRAILFEADGAHAAAPVALTGNTDSWLMFTDLVFIDPVATGFSRAVHGEDGEKAYLGVEKDADALTEVIRLYLARTGKSLTPVMLAGESYGGFRAALLAQRLVKMGVQLKGMVMISPALEFSLLWGDRYSLLPDALMLPAIAASHFEAERHQPVSPADAAGFEAFALGPYLSHAAAGLALDPALETALSAMTGLPPETIARNHDRISVGLYAREYERARDRAFSRYDGAVSMGLPQPARGHHGDPILDGAVAVLQPAFENYSRTELGVKTDLDYKLLNHGVAGKWDFGTSAHQQGYAGALDELEEARTLSPGLGIHIVHGLTDLVTPFPASRYLVSQMRPIEGARPVTVSLLPGGHMMYLRPTSRRALSEDVAAFYADVLGTR